MTPQSNEAEAAVHGARYYTHAGSEADRQVMYQWLKRCMDIAVSLTGLILLSPVFLVIALLIKLEDPRGSVFFSQTRIGKDEKPFRMYKFRSMVANAESLLKDLLEQNEVEGAMFKMKHDPRVTRIGAILRKTSLDELPQLFNVLRGEMSLVGPRPPLEREVAEYTDYDRQRLTVKPGCTGLWQISGRSNLSFAQMVNLDIRYIRERGLFLDLKILIGTVRVLLGSKDAF